MDSIDDRLASPELDLLEVDDPTLKDLGAGGYGEGERMVEAAWMLTEPDEIIHNGTAEDAHLADQVGQGQYIKQPEGESPTMGQIAGAAWRRENTIGSITSDKYGRFGIEQGYDPFEDPQFKQYPDRVDLWGFSRSQAESASIIEQFEQEDQDNLYLENGGGRAIASMIGAAVLDPVFWPFMFVPVLNTVRGGKPLLNAAEWAAGGFVSETMAEAIKHETQMTRTMEESLWNIGASTLLSGVLGAAVGGLVGKELAATTKQVAKHLRGELDSNFVGPPTPQKTGSYGFGKGAAGAEFQQSVGARGVYDVADLEDYALKPTGIGLEKMPANPIIRMAQSPVPMVRKMGLWLADSPYYHKGHDKGMNLSSELGSIESRSKAYDAIYASASQELENGFFKYRGADGTIARLKTSVSDIKGQSAGSNVLTWDMYKTEVSKAMRREDSHAIKEVGDAAKALRKNVFEPIKEEAQRLGMLPENLKSRTALTYLTRMWDRDAINKNYDELKGLISTYFEEQQQQLAKRMESAGVQRDFLEGQSLQKTQEVNDLKTYLKSVDTEAGDIQEYMKRVDVDLGDSGQVQRALGLEGRPQSLSVFIRSNGGITDYHGELKASDITNEALPGLVTRKGRQIDYVKEEAFDAEYFPGKMNVNEISNDEFYAAINGDLHDVKLWDARVEEGLDAIRYQQESPEFRFYEEQGLGRTSSKGEVKEFIHKRNSQPVDIEGSLPAKQKAAKESARTYGKFIDELEEEKPFLDLTKDDLDDLAGQTIENILGTAAGRLDPQVIPSNLATKASPLKERVLLIPDAKVEKFLNNDVDQLTKAYTKTMGSQIELTRDFGDIQLTQPVETLRNQYAIVRETETAKLEAAGKSEVEIGKEMQKLRKQEDRDVSDMMALRDKLLGQFKQPQDPDAFWYRLGNFVKRVNFLRLLGGMQISAIPDLARPIMTRGFRPVAKTMSKMNTSVYKMAVQDIKKAGVGWEAVLNSRAYSWADLTDDMMYRSKPERYIDSMSNSFGKISLMTPWNDTLKMFSGVMVQDDIVGTLVKRLDGGEITPKQIRELARSNISENMGERIAEQSKKYGKSDEGLWIPNASKWDDVEAAMSLRSAVVKATDEIIVTPGIGEMPLWVSGPVASHIMQFKSFILSAHNRVLISGLQARDQAALNGLLLAVALGSLVYTTKSALAGREINTDNWGDFMYESVDRSGVLGWLNEPMQMVNKATRGRVNPRNLWGGGDQELSRYASRNIWGALLGPTTDLVGDLVSTTGALSTGEISDGDVKAMRRMLPYQNLWYMNWLLNAGQEKAADNITTN